MKNVKEEQAIDGAALVAAQVALVEQWEAQHARVRLADVIPADEAGTRWVGEKFSGFLSSPTGDPTVPCTRYHNPITQVGGGCGSRGYIGDGDERRVCPDCFGVTKLPSLQLVEQERAKLALVAKLRAPDATDEAIELYNRTQREAREARETREAAQLERAHQEREVYARAQAEVDKLRGEPSPDLRDPMVRARYAPTEASK